MGNRSISVLLIFIFLSSCGGNERNSSKVLDNILVNYSDSISYFDTECINSFSKAFIDVNVLDKKMILKEACVFYPKSNIIAEGIFKNYNSNLFLAFYVSNDTENLYQTYIYDTYNHEFTPILLEEMKIEVDTLYMLQLYFGDPIICGGKTIKGNIYKDASKNSFYKRIYKGKEMQFD